MDELKKRIVSFCQDRDWLKFNTPKEVAIGLTLEACEVLELFRYKDSSERKKLENEMADVFFCLLLLAHIEKIDLRIALLNKLKENEMKYPIHLAKGTAKNMMN